MSTFMYVLAMPLASVCLDELIRHGDDDPDEWAWWAKAPLIAAWPVLGVLCFVGIIGVLLARIWVRFSSAPAEGASHG